jgi:hypothetical protein
MLALTVGVQPERKAHGGRYDGQPGVWQGKNPCQDVRRAGVGGCPHCGAPWRRCIYMGLPLRMCVNGGCNTLVGAGAWLCDVLPITTDDGEFAFMAYEGGYLKALWHWLYHGPE